MVLFLGPNSVMALYLDPLGEFSGRAPVPGSGVRAPADELRQRQAASVRPNSCPGPGGARELRATHLRLDGAIPPKLWRLCGHYLDP